ncbi:MAG: hypothetical protein ACLP7P_14850 [Rhodomicrobium sp.]
MTGDPAGRQRAAGDFIAGMSDMLAIKTHAKVLDRAPD